MERVCILRNFLSVINIDMRIVIDADESLRMNSSCDACDDFRSPGSIGNRWRVSVLVHTDIYIILDTSLFFDNVQGLRGPPDSPARSLDSLLKSY